MAKIYNEGAGKLRQQIDQGKLVWAPGAWDVASAMVIEKAGFEAVALQSYQISVRDGLPDNGIGSAHELLDLVRRVDRAVNIPIIVDFEHGFGDAYNAAYWLQEFERAGAAAVHIDDYDYPYHCPFIPPFLPTLRSEEGVAAQIRAMAAERLNPDTIIIARSGAGACRGYEGREARVAESNRRSKVYRDAGADMIFAHVVDRDHLLSLRETVKAPLLLQQFVPPSAAETGGKPMDYKIGLMDITVDELHKLGVNIVTDPTTLQGVAFKAMTDAAAKQRQTRTVVSVADDAISFHGLAHQFMDFDNAFRILSK